MYSETAHNHFHNPQRAGTLADADVVGQGGIPGQGPYIVLYLKVTEGQIIESRFQTYGCPAAIASGSWVADWVVGKTLDEVGMLQPSGVVDGLGGLPLGKEHCAPLAVAALGDALRQLRESSQLCK